MNARKSLRLSSFLRSVFLLSLITGFLIGCAVPTGTISTGKQAYSSGEKVNIQWQIKDADESDCIVVAKEGAKPTEALAEQLTGGSASGKAEFPAEVEKGAKYEARYYAFCSKRAEDMVGKSQTFTVN